MGSILAVKEDGERRKDRDTNNDTEPMDFNIMATLDSGENDVENHGQGTKNETQREQGIQFIEKQPTVHL